MRYFAAFILFLVSIIALMFYMAGMHGHLMFRSHMKEDWVIWGISILSFIAGLMFLLRQRKKKRTL